MKRGPKPKGQVRIGWTRDFAYAIGLITADGNLSRDGRHIDFTSKDLSLVRTFKQALRINAPVRPKKSGGRGTAYHVQFSDVLFYQFLLSIGLTPAKSKTIQAVSVPDDVFTDFLRGYFDGDGTSFSYRDSLFPNSVRFYVAFTSASHAYLIWLRGRLRELYALNGHFCFSADQSYSQLRFAKREAVSLASLMYTDYSAPRLRRKHLKIRQSMRIIGGRRGGEIGRRTAFRSQRSQGHGSSSLPHGTK